MLSKSDVALLRGMFQEQEVQLEIRLTEKLTGTLTEKLTGTLTEKLTKVIDERLDIRFTDFKHEVRDEIHSVVNAAVFASEERLGRKIDMLRDDILEVISDEILPQIDEHTRQITVINRHLKLA